MTTRRYAEGTTVAAAQTRVEIERLLERHGATAFASGQEAGRAVVAFVLNGRQLRFEIPLPAFDAPEFKRTTSGRLRSAAAAREACRQELRRRWRALLLVLKAKLEATSSGVVSFEQEFAAFVVLPDGRTVGDWLLPQLDQAYADNEMPPLLPGAGTPLQLEDRR